MEKLGTRLSSHILELILPNLPRVSKKCDGIQNIKLVDINMYFHLRKGIMQ